MTDKKKQAARLIQDLTGWSYMESLRCFQEVGETATVQLMIDRGLSDAAKQYQEHLVRVSARRRIRLWG